ncbi:glycosyltransferase family 2 protein [Sporolactobacillus sp. KGMB 08714]|uniref:glycosyltransferase family 2 protein n=1 Tax=Sporolactobacillus sp. KGMB 08714 TaxID=3064704 RepID=UPI002FBDF6B7
MKVSFIIPVYNPGPDIKELVDCIKDFSLKNKEGTEILVVDSSSTDGSTRFMENDPSIKLIKIKKSDFNHGGTRNTASSLANGEYLIFLTQDVVIRDSQCFGNLIRTFEEDPKIGIAYGRQLPKSNADFLGRTSRQINYPPQSQIKSLVDKTKLGIKTIFVSNSFAAYRKRALDEIHGFPTDVIMNEDQYVGAKMIEHGWSIAYCADACVYHSHNYTHSQEFKRYFDIGVFFGKEKWILEEFSQAEGEGAKFVVHQFRSLLADKQLSLIPGFVLRNFLKYLGYKLGMNEKLLPLFIKKKLSMNKQYWNNKG